MKNQATSPPPTNGSFILAILAGFDKWPLGSLLLLYPYLIFLIKKSFKFILTALGLCGCAGFSLAWRGQGLLSGCARASHCSGISCCAARALGPSGPSSWGSWALEHGLSSVVHGSSGSTACGIFQGQGWKADSSPLSHQESPFFPYFKFLPLQCKFTNKEWALKP